MPSRTTETFPTRIQLEAVRADLAVRIPLTVKAGSRVRRAAVLGVVTATDYVRERTRTKAAGTGFANNSAVGQVDDASLFIATDVLKLEDGTTIGTVLSVDTTTTPDTITLTGNAAVNVAVGDAVLGSDGSQAAKAIADEAVADTEAQDTVLSPYIGGALKKDQIIGLDDSAIAEMGGASFPGNIFKF
jgi:hypothetical protein